MEQDFEHLKKVAQILNKAGLKQKEIAISGSRVFYFRADEFLKLGLENKDKINQILKKSSITPIDTEDDVHNLGEQMVGSKLMLRLDRVPVSSVSSGEREKVLKWPKKLQLAKDQSLNKKGFYTWTFKTTHKLAYILLPLIIIAVIGVCLFPVWPLSFKIYAWYISFGLLNILGGLIGIRLIIYGVFFLLGIDVWLLPKIFDDDSGFIESFKPLITFERRYDDWIWGTFRLLSVVTLVFFGYQLYKEPDVISEYRSYGAQSYQDLFEWGQIKIAGDVSGNPNKDMRDIIMDHFTPDEKEESEESTKANEDL